MKLALLGLSVLFHPTDTFMAVKRHRGKSLVLQSVLLIALLLVARLVYILLLHYPVSGFDLRSKNLFLECAVHVGVILSVALANWNVTEILDGEVFFRESLFGTALSAMPMTVLYIPIALISNIMGQSEAAFLNIFTAVMWGWTIFLLVRGIMVMNNYSFPKTLLICLISLVYIAILWCCVLMLVVFTKNLWQFIEGLFVEITVSLS